MTYASVGSSARHHPAAFSTFVSQWTAYMVHMDGGSGREPEALSSCFGDVWRGAGWATPEDFVALWHAAKTSRREWQMSCLLRSRLRATPDCPQPQPRRGAAADRRPAVALAPLALGLLCWAAAVAGRLHWFFTACHAEITSLVREECAARQQQQQRDCSGSDHRGVAASLALALYGWFEAVICVAVQADELADPSTEDDIVAFLERVGTRVVQPALAVPTLPSSSSSEVPARRRLAEKALHATPKAFGDAPASPTIRAGAQNTSHRRAPAAAPPPRPAQAAVTKPHSEAHATSDSDTNSINSAIQPFPRARTTPLPPQPRRLPAAPVSPAKAHGKPKDKPRKRKGSAAGGSRDNCIVA